MTENSLIAHNKEVDMKTPSLEAVDIEVEDVNSIVTEVECLMCVRPTLQFVLNLFQAP